MPLEKAEYGHFVYISYAGEGFSDYEHLKRELDRSAGIVSGSKDVVVDFTDCPDIGSPEMNALVILVRSLQQLHRTVHVVAPAPVNERLISVNLHRLPYVAIHQSRDAAIAHVAPSKPAA